MGEPAAAAVELAIGEPGGAIDDGELVGVSRCRLPQKDERSWSRPDKQERATEIVLQQASLYLGNLGDRCVSLLVYYPRSTDL